MSIDSDIRFSAITEAITQRGVAVTRGGFGEDLIGNARAIASLLGKPVPTRRGRSDFDVLRPTEASAAKGSSLSARFGSGEFPLHVDTAHWVVPCRFLVLACEDPGAESRPTRILDWHSLSLGRAERDLLLSAAFKVVNGRRSFFSSVLSTRRHFVRYDPGCMRAVDRRSEDAVGLIAELGASRFITEFAWEKGLILVIDNWRVLHGRGPSECPDHNRCRFRVSVV